MPPRAAGQRAHAGAGAVPGGPGQPFPSECMGCMGCMGCQDPAARSRAARARWCWSCARRTWAILPIRVHGVHGVMGCMGCQDPAARARAARARWCWSCAWRTWATFCATRRAAWTRAWPRRWRGSCCAAWRTCTAPVRRSLLPAPASPRARLPARAARVPPGAASKARMSGPAYS